MARKVLQYCGDMHEIEILLLDGKGRLTVKFIAMRDVVGLLKPSPVAVCL